MSDIESFSPSDGAPEGGQGSPEKVKEQSEKQSEQSRKAAAGIGRTQKDEGKAKKHDFLLANFLREIIMNKKYDFIMDDMFTLMDSAYPSNFILGVISLIYLPISMKIREMTGKEKYTFKYLEFPEHQTFNDREIDEGMKKRINYWIEDIIDIVSFGPSTVSTLRLRKLIQEDENVVAFVAKIFTFFLNENTLAISESKSKSYALFIIGEVGKALEKLNLEEV